MERFLSVLFHCYISSTKINSRRPVNAVEVTERKEGGKEGEMEGRNIEQ